MHVASSGHLSENPKTTTIDQRGQEEEESLPQEQCLG